MGYLYFKWQVQSLTTIHNQCTTTLSALSSESAARALTDIQIMCTRVLEMIGETRHLEARPSPAKLIHEEGGHLQASSPSMDKASPIRGRGRGKHRGRGRGMQCVRSALSPCSSLFGAPSYGDDLEQQAHLNTEETALQVESDPNQPLAEPMHHLEDQKKEEIAATQTAEPMDMLESIKEMETTQTSPEDTSNDGLFEIAELEPPYEEDRPKKKKKLKHI